MTKSVYCVGIGLLVAGPLAGCAVALDEGEPGEAAATRGEAVIGNPNPGQSEFSWASGEPTKQMTPKGTSACFFTEIHGRFRGTGDRVRITTGSENWQLTGAGPSTSGTARCITLPTSPVISWTWSAGEPGVDLGTTSNRACFLVDIYGKFDSDEDFVKTRIYGSHWYLEGSIDTGGATARCFSGSSIVALGAVTSGQNVDVVDASAASACFMTALGGNLWGADIFYPPSFIPVSVGGADLVVREVQHSQLSWNLSSGAGTATARCIP